MARNLRRHRPRAAHVRPGAVIADTGAATTLEYVAAAIVLALIALAASRILLNVLIDYLHRIYLVASLPTP